MDEIDFNIQSHPIDLGWVKPDDWERWRPRIEELYITNKLENVIKLMKEEAGFKAT